MIMTAHFNKKAEEIIRNKILSEHNCITVKPGKCRWNFRCHNNAIHEAVRKGDKEIAMVIYFDKGCPIVHFINYRKGQYIDNTLGEWTQRYEYYFIKFIPQEDFWNVYTFHNTYRIHLRSCLPWIVRKLSNIEF